MEGRKPEKGMAAWLLLCACLSVGYCFLHPALLFRLTDHSWFLPGVGRTLSVMLGIAGLGIVHRKRLRFCWEGGMLLALSLLLALNDMLHGNQVLRWLNGPVLAGMAAAGMFSLTGQLQHAPLSLSGWCEMIRRVFPALFRYMGVPFRWLQGHGSKQTAWALCAGLALSVLVLCIVIPLLRSADSVFGDMLAGAVQWLEQIDAGVVWHGIRACILTLMLFSLGYALTVPPRLFPDRKRRRVPGVTLMTLLGVLAVVYGTFVYVQLRHFAGGGAADMGGSYAHDARSGFFQLVFVALINLMISLPAVRLCPDSRGVRMLSALVSLLTLVILFSALMRMLLYIQSFGLSLLRLLTLWAMAMIFLALVLTMYQCARPGKGLGRMFLTVLLISWTALNLCGADMLIARYNVRAYNEGRLPSLDSFYLVSLSPDVLPALEKIEDAELREETVEMALHSWQEDLPAWYDSSLGYWGIQK